jgi:hypothetical protein
VETLTCILISSLAALAGLAIGYALARLLDRSRLRTVRTEAEAIAAKARLEAEKVIKEAELQA